MWKKSSLILCLLAFPAMAQNPCGKYEEAEKHLKEKYGEQVMFIGNMSNETQSATAQFWVNKTTKSWTILVVDDKGNACVVAAGDELRQAPAPKPAEQKS